MIPSILAFLLVFTIVVLVHESGHFIAARKTGVKAYEFSIGFPFSPRIATLFRHGETEFTLRLLPLGGFVSFSKDAEEGTARQFLSEKRWKRFVIASAGSVFNIAFAFIAIFAAYLLGRDMGLIDGAAASLKTVETATAGTVKLLLGLFSGKGSLEGLSGPIGIAALAGKAAHGGLYSLLYFTGMLSLSLGIFNLLPLPALDGGHILIILIESIKRRPLSIGAYKAVGVAGISFLLLLTLMVSYRDILKLIA